MITNYVNDINLPYAQTLMTSDANGTYRGVYTYGLERISESDQVSVEGVPNDPLFYLYDGRGSVSQLVNTPGTVKDKYRYTPFGVPMPGGQLTPNTRLFNNPYGYNGEDYDIESGLQFLRARYYNPETARFITRDSYLGDVMEPLSLNRYAYTANNPLKYTDPSGHIYVSEDEGNKQVEAYNNLYYKSLSQPAKNGPVLKVGSTNKGSIKELQNILINLGYDLGPSGADGYFGEKTKTAVIKFQKSNGLDTDGIVGAKTWKSLQREQTDNENIKSVMKIKEHDYVAEKTSQSKTVSKNDVGCGDKEDISSGTQGTDKTKDTVLSRIANGTIVNAFRNMWEFNKNSLLTVMGDNSQEGVVYVTEDQVQLAEIGADMVTGEAVGSFVPTIVGGIRTIKSIKNGGVIYDNSSVVAGSGIGGIAKGNPTKLDFGKHLRNLIGNPPKDMIDPHAHHILFKEGNGAVQKALVKEGQELLRRYGIDPITGKENLVWAPNRIKGQHDIGTLQKVVDRLKAVEKAGGDYDDIVEALQKLGRDAATKK